VDLPEEFGGLGQDLTTSALVFEVIGGCGSGSFAAAVGAHSGIGTWPIMYFGSEEQKRRFLPGIMSGQAHRGLRPDRIGQRQRRARGQVQGGPGA